MPSEETVAERAGAVDDEHAPRRHASLPELKADEEEGDEVAEGERCAGDCEESGRSGSAIERSCEKGRRTCEDNTNHRTHSRQKGYEEVRRPSELCVRRSSSVSRSGKVGRGATTHRRRRCWRSG